VNDEMTHAASSAAVRERTEDRLAIAMLGTRGVPARYGGAETAVEEVGQRLVGRGHTVRVYCRGDEGETPPTYLGMELVQLPAVKRRTVEALSHTALSATHLLRAPADVAFLFNSANARWLPALRAARIPVATHVDGRDWKRATWRGAGRRYHRLADHAVVRLSDALIADAQGVADYYQVEFGAQTELISYGAALHDQVGHSRLSAVGLRPRDYHLVVARFEPENHVDLIVDGFRRSGAAGRLVVVGSAPYADAYTTKVHALADEDPRVLFLGGVWDQDLLDELYGNCLTYLHGHSVGGTNPSLLRAIGAGAPCTAFDVPFNREVLLDDGLYFRTRDEVVAAVEAAEHDRVGTVARGQRLRTRATSYDWDDVADRYEALARALVRGTTSGPPRAARRGHASRRVVGVSLEPVETPTAS
jgi:glycosyltransferase involved in cell wall biosynthesis